MKSFGRFYCLLSMILGLIILFGCGGDDEVVSPSQPPRAPINVFGAPTVLTEGVDMLLLWTDADSGMTGSYNIYRKIGDGAAVKLNGPTVSASPFGPTVYHPQTLWFADTTYDTASGLTHRYYITAINSDGESNHSDTVLCIPNTIDRNNGIDNLSPADMSEIGLNPAFTWDIKTGAASYLLILGNDLDYDSYWPWWLHRVTTAECAFKTAPGITYLDASQNSLFEAHEYTWVLWAVNADNCGFAMSMADFVSADPDFSLVFVDGILNAGRYRICWDQTDLNGLQVAPGTYEVRMTAGEFETAIAFDLITPAGPVTVRDCNEDFTGIMPAAFTLDLNSEAYLVGDTVQITYDLPVVSAVRIEIGR